MGVKYIQTRNSNFIFLIKAKLIFLLKLKFFILINFIISMLIALYYSNFIYKEYLIPRREGRKNLSLRYSIKLVGRPRRPLLLPLLNHPGGATLFNLVSGGKIAKSPANNTARPRVKFSSRLSACTMAWNQLRGIHYANHVITRDQRYPLIRYTCKSRLLNK